MNSVISFSEDLELSLNSLKSVYIRALFRIGFSALASASASASSGRSFFFFGTVIAYLISG